jgi:hypothetical protein
VPTHEQEIRRLKKKVNRIVRERDKAQEAIREMEEDAAGRPDVDIDIIHLALDMIGTEHDSIHHAGTCQTCRALNMLEREFNFTPDPTRFHTDAWKKVNGVTQRG